MGSLHVRNTENGHSAVPYGSSSARWRRVLAQLQKLRAWRKRLGLETTLSGLEDYQLDDLGITRGEITAYAMAAPYAPRLLSAMLEELEVALDSVGPRLQAHGELLKVCRVCPNVAACERWLLKCEPTDEYRTFCPNVALLDKLPRRSGKRHASGGLLQAIAAHRPITVRP